MSNEKGLSGMCSMRSRWQPWQAWQCQHAHGVALGAAKVLLEVQIQGPELERGGRTERTEHTVLSKICDRHDIIAIVNRIAVRVS